MQGILGPIQLWKTPPLGVVSSLGHSQANNFSLFSLLFFQFRLSHVRLYATPRSAARQASLSITTNSWSLFELMSIESVIPSNHLILCRPLLLPPFKLSQHQGLFWWVNSSYQVAKVLARQHQSFQWIFRRIILRVDLRKSGGLLPSGQAQAANSRTASIFNL